jgi:hypothetical protein
MIFGKVLAAREARDVSGIRRPAEILEDAVDAVARARRKLRQVEAGQAQHVGRERADSARVGHH